MSEDVLEPETAFDGAISSRTYVIDPVTWPINREVVSEKSASALELMTSDTVIPIMRIGPHHFKQLPVQVHKKILLKVAVHTMGGQLFSIHH